MDKAKKRNGTMKAVCIVALALVMTGTLVVLAAEKSERAYLGVSARRLDGDEREKLGVVYGVLVATVEKESGAAKAGILDDDIIQSVNGEKIRDPQSLSEVVRELAPGTAVRIGLWRNGKALEVKAILGKFERPKHFTWEGGLLSKVISHGAYLGVNLLELDADLAGYFGVKAGEGVLINRVEGGTPAEKAGLKSGDVIVEMGGKAVKTSRDIFAALADLKKGDRIDITVVRHGKKETLKAEPDYDRQKSIMRFFDKGQGIEINHLELPELDIEIPEIDFVAPCPPDMPASAEIVRHVHEKLDKLHIKIGKHLHKIGENSRI